jgi:hypothetical protein
VALFTQGIRAGQERRRIQSPGEQCALKADNDFFIDAPPMFGGALLDSLVKLVRNVLDRYAWHGGTSMDPIWNHFGTIVSTVRLSVKFLTLDSTERAYLFLPPASAPFTSPLSSEANGSFSLNKTMQMLHQALA